jgi:hypothetical protein
LERTFYGIEYEPGRLYTDLVLVVPLWGAHTTMHRGEWPDSAIVAGEVTVTANGAIAAGDYVKLSSVST